MSNAFNPLYKMARKKIEYLMDYYPRRTDVESEERTESRRKISMFLNGDCPQEVMDEFIARICELEKTDPDGDWVVGFIPAPDGMSTIMRYGNLALEIGEKTDSVAYLDIFEEERGKRNFGYAVNRSHVEGNNVILVDALLETGRRYRLFSTKVRDAGAKRVYGIIVGKVRGEDQ